MDHELRKQKRYHTHQGIIAAFFRPDQSESFMLGEIVDISDGGMGLCYVDIEEQYGESLQVSIYGLDDTILVDRIPCKMVHDAVLPEDSNIYSVLGVKRCGVQLMGVTKEQMEQLRRFISEITSRNREKTI